MIDPVLVDRQVAENQLLVAGQNLVPVPENVGGQLVVEDPTTDHGVVPELTENVRQLGVRRRPADPDPRNGVGLRQGIG